LEEEIAALLGKANAELGAEAAADQARQRERKPRCAEQQAAEAQASANEGTAQADAAAEAEAAKIRANAARRPASSPLLERRDNGPKPPRRWPCRRPRRLVSGLQRPGGGRWSPPGDRGGGDQQPGQGKPHLLPMLEWILSNTRQLPHKLLADAGICSTDTIEVSRGLDRFLLRGTENTFGELNLIAITHNLLKLLRATLNPA
jgi:hypothetical protein